MSRRGRRFRITLVEILIVVAIMAILAAIMIPAVINVRAEARVGWCMNNVRQLYLGLVVYSDNWNGLFPPYDPIIAMTERDMISDSSGQFNQGLGLLFGPHRTSSVFPEMTDELLACPDQKTPTGLMEKPGTDGQYRMDRNYLGWSFQRGQLHSQPDQLRHRHGADIGFRFGMRQALVSNSRWSLANAWRQEGNSRVCGRRNEGVEVR